MLNNTETLKQKKPNPIMQLVLDNFELNEKIMTGEKGDLIEVVKSRVVKIFNKNRDIKKDG